MENGGTIQELAEDLYASLARRFPVCCYSDEFVFFPQAVEVEIEWSRWDDLSPGSMEDAVTDLGAFRRCLDEFTKADSVGVEDERVLASTLAWVIGTLEEQFTLVKTHATQPTFALTVATVGLVQALQSGEEGAWDQRLGTLPGFLDGVTASLAEVPELYRDLGMEMVQDLTGWLRSIGPPSLAGPVLEALDNFAAQLSELPVATEFVLAPELFEHMVTNHTGSGLTLSEAFGEIEDEAAVTKQLLAEEADKLEYDRGWESVFLSINGDPVPADGKKGLLRLEIERLRDHCRHHGFLTDNPAEADSIFIEPLPSSLVSIRAADSYNARPGHPFKGGVFYIFGDGSLGNSSGTVHPVYRMTAAHETYPGHHLLDLSRWNNPRSALRPIEYPLFYEGWACFGEDLMLHTGAFDRSCDRLILLRRRHRHAVRGKVDLMLHSGKMGLREAARELMSAGFSRNRAWATVRKYALRPAYQMCYTVGRRRFQRLFHSYGQEDTSVFVNTVLSQGEILFEDLEKALKKTTGRGDAETRLR
jgi:hypothetical protein